jgi:predicted  nucleic acid-binding Zn-ribbon protein
MSDQVVATAPQDEPVREVDRIRDIIFGTNMRDYEQRFQAVQRELDRLQRAVDDLNSRLASTDGAQTKSLQKLGHDLQEAQATMRVELDRADEGLRAELQQAVGKLTFDKTDRAALGELFVQLADRLRADGSGS